MIRILFRLFVVVCVIAAALWVYQGGRMLVADAPEHADAIVSLEGENDVRIARALELLRAGYAPVMFLDVAEHAAMFGQTELSIAQRYVDALPEDVRSRVRLCSVRARSTQQEARADVPCFEAVHAHNILIVTSDFHSRRALTIYRHELPAYHFSVAAAYDPAVYGTRWWQHREWAKQYVGETARFVWFEAVDRWRH